MISYSVYKIIHVFGVLLIVMALGGATLHAANGGTRESNTSRKLSAISHGVGMLLVLVAGFGLLARLGIGHGAAWPLWIYLKLVIWAVMGGLLVLVQRVPSLARPLWIGIPLLGGLAAYVAVMKPGA
ncbi:MAG: hypothetical protein ACKO6N_22665 [Myxococcota bacterium]